MEIMGYLYLWNFGTLLTNSKCHAFLFALNGTLRINGFVRPIENGENNILTEFELHPYTKMILKLSKRIPISYYCIRSSSIK